jgi:hypothetical protein
MVTTSTMSTQAIATQIADSQEPMKMNQSTVRRHPGWLRSITTVLGGV